MAIVQQILVDKLINYMDELIHRGKVKLNGEYLDYAIHQTVRVGNVLRKYIVLDTEMGEVTEAQLLSAAGEVLAVRPFSIKKDDNGLVLAFEFTIVVEEA